jgi:hypothetical protein
MNQQQHQLAVEIEMQRMKICHELKKRLKDILEGRGASSTDLVVVGTFVHVQLYEYVQVRAIMKH